MDNARQIGIQHNDNIMGYTNKDSDRFHQHFLWDIRALSYGFGWDGNDPLLMHISRVHYFVGTSCGR